MEMMTTDVIKFCLTINVNSFKKAKFILIEEIEVINYNLSPESDFMTS